MRIRTAVVSAVVWVLVLGLLKFTPVCRGAPALVRSEDFRKARSLDIVTRLYRECRRGWMCSIGSTQVSRGLTPTSALPD